MGPKKSGLTSVKIHSECKNNDSVSALFFVDLKKRMPSEPLPSQGMLLDHNNLESLWRPVPALKIEGRAGEGGGGGRRGAWSFIPLLASSIFLVMEGGLHYIICVITMVEGIQPINQSVTLGDASCMLAFWQVKHFTAFSPNESKKNTAVVRCEHTHMPTWKSPRPAFFFFFIIILFFFLSFVVTARKIKQPPCLCSVKRKCSFESCMGTIMLLNLNWLWLKISWHERCSVSPVGSVWCICVSLFVLWWWTPPPHPTQTLMVASVNRNELVTERNMPCNRSAKCQTVAFECNRNLTWN